MAHPHSEPGTANIDDATGGEQISVVPVDQAHRQLSLDFIRGIAIFGILIMNIQLFGNVFTSYFNPTVNGDFTGINRATWYITHIFFEQKFYTIFSMLFGAGVVLMAEKAAAKGASAAKIHYRRNLILLVFGACHGFFIWYGDILLTYALFALFVYAGWKSKPRNLIIAGLLLSILISLLMLSGAGSMPPEEVAKMQNQFLPSLDIIQREVQAYRGGWSDNQVLRLEAMQQMIGFIAIFGIRIAGCMLLGMALFKLGIINGLRSKNYYRNLALLCLIPGLLIVTYGATLMVESGFEDAIKIQMVYGQINFLASIVVALGYIGLFHWFYLSDGGRWFKSRFEAVGQMAFTNYISQSVLCTLIFYGIGFGLFSTLSRAELILVAIAVFTLQFVWSKWWLEKFNFGPLEWLWRSLTYFKLQPFKK